MAAICALLADGDVAPVVNVIGFDDIPVDSTTCSTIGSPARWWHASATEFSPGSGTTVARTVPG